MENKISRNISLDVLKILACFSVVILHVFGRDPNILNSVFYYIATFAIPIFFMVNGYLLINKKDITYNYVLKKILKILLIVIFWNIILSIGVIVIKHEWRNPIIETAKNLLQKGTFSHFWFFGSLIIIYLFLPKLHKIVNKKKKIYQRTLLFLFIFCIIIDIINIILGIQGKGIFTVNVIQTFRLWTWLFYFLLGGYIGKYKTEIGNNKNIKFKLITIFATFFVIVYQYFIGNYVFKNYHAEYFYDNIFIIIYVLLVWYGVYSKSAYQKYESKIEKINKCIMGIYILHPLVIKLISKYYNYGNCLINIVMFSIIIVICMIISIIIDKIPKLKEIIKM